MDTAAPAAVEHTADCTRLNLIPLCWPDRDGVPPCVTEYRDAEVSAWGEHALRGEGIPLQVHYLHIHAGLVGPFATAAEAGEYDPSDDRLEHGVMDIRAWLFVTAGLDIGDGHVPGHLYDLGDPDHLGSPAEVCNGCSDYQAGRIVPVSFCPPALALADIVAGLRAW